MMTHPDSTTMPAGGVARGESEVSGVITGPDAAIDAHAVRSGVVPVDTFLHTRDLASLIHVDPSTLRHWRNAEPPAGPPFTRLSPRRRRLQRPRRPSLDRPGPYRPGGACLMAKQVHVPIGVEVKGYMEYREMPLTWSGSSEGCPTA